jgi:hypothetical protein
MVGFVLAVLLAHRPHRRQPVAEQRSQAGDDVVRRRNSGWRQVLHPPLPFAAKAAASASAPAGAT